MKKKLLILCFVFIASANLYASPATHSKAAEELLLVAGTDKTLDDAVGEQVKIQVNNTPELAPYESIIKKYTLRYMGWESLKGYLIKFYTEVFTEDEINYILQFYKNPTGRKMFEKKSELLIKAAKIGEQRVRENLPELESMIELEAAKINKKIR